MGVVSKISKITFRTWTQKMTPKSCQKELQLASWIDSKPTQNGTWIQYKHMMKNWSRKYRIWGPKWVRFLAFLAPKIDLQRHLEPSWAPKLKIHEKRDAEVLKIDTYCADIDLETSKNDEFQAPKKAISESMWLRLNKAAKPFKRPGGMRRAIE